MTPRRFITIVFTLAAMLAFSSSAFAAPGAVAASPLSPATVGASDLALVRTILSFLLPGLVSPPPADLEPAAPDPTTLGEDDPQGGHDGPTVWPTARLGDYPDWGDLLPKP